MLGPVLGGHAAEHRLLGQRLSPDGNSIELRYALALKPEIPTARFIEALHHACGNRRLVLTPAGGETD